MVSMKDLENQHIFIDEGICTAVHLYVNEYKKVKHRHIDLTHQFYF